MSRGKGGQTGPMRRKKNKSRKGGRGAGNSVFNAENASNAGDLGMIPRGWQQPGLSNQVYKVRRISDSADANQAAGAVAFFGTSFSLAGVDAVADFTDLFDLYRISLVRMKLRPRFNVGSLGATGTGISPRLYTAIDYSDATAPAAISTLRQYSTCKETNSYSDHVRCFVPRPELAAISTTATTVLAVLPDGKPNPWISTAATTIAHFGLKGAIEAGIGGQTALQSWSIEVEYFLEFRMAD